MTATITFERDTCSRCGGSGTFGRYGVCFGCDGHKTWLTPAGRRARDTYRALLAEAADKVEAHTLDLGQRIYADGQYREIVSYTRKSGKVYISTHNKSYVFGIRQLVSLKPSAEQMDAIRERMRGVRGAVVSDG